MENKYINRYNSLCRSLDNLERSTVADPRAPFVLEGTAQMFNLTFDLSWKVMKDILVKHFGIVDYATGSPRENLRLAFSNGLITDDVWLQMLKTRNNLTHDYDGTIAEAVFENISTKYYFVFLAFQRSVEKYYKNGLSGITSFE